jgi:hypothetical protein
MNSGSEAAGVASPTLLHRLDRALADLDPHIDAAGQLNALVAAGLGDLPLPGGGQTLLRWQALAAVSGHDLSLGKLYEGHTDALAVMRELAPDQDIVAGSTWGMWAAEVPTGRTTVERRVDGRLSLRGAKSWCSGAGRTSHGLLTAWPTHGAGPQLVRVVMQQGGVTVDGRAWRAVGMARSASVDVSFAGAVGDAVGTAGDYLSRPGFWQGGAGIAACWYGGARALGVALRRSVARTTDATRSLLGAVAVGRVDVVLHNTAAQLREAALWIDAHPLADASDVSLRARLTAERCARVLLDEAGRALGATAYCRDPHFARMAADLPVFVRQSHAERDFAALGERVAASLPSEHGDTADSPWTL